MDDLEGQGLKAAITREKVNDETWDKLLSLADRLLGTIRWTF